MTEEKDEFEAILDGVDTTKQDSGKKEVQDLLTMHTGLKEILAHTVDLGGFITKVRIDNNVKDGESEKSTRVFGLEDASKLIINCRFHKPLTEFEGTIGISELRLLKSILNASFMTKSNLEVVEEEGKDGSKKLAELKFTSSEGAN